MAERDPLAALAERIRDELAERRWGQNKLSEETGIAESDLSKILSRELMVRALKRLRQLARIETAFGLRPGDLLRDMGFVEDADTARRILESDPSLTAAGREAMLVLFDHDAAKKTSRIAQLELVQDEREERTRAAKQGEPPEVPPAGEEQIEGWTKDRVPDDDEHDDNGGDGREDDNGDGGEQ